MKFGRRFEDDLQEVGWEDHYLQYRLLKEFIRTNSQEHDKCLHRTTTVQSEDATTDADGDSSTAPVVVDLHLRCRSGDVICKDCFAAEQKFLQLVSGDVSKINNFVRVSLDKLQLIFDNVLRDGVDTLVESSKSAYARTNLPYEPLHSPSTEDEKILAALATWVYDLHALRQFILVNERALDKILKKFAKWCASSFLSTSTPSSLVGQSSSDETPSCLLDVDGTPPAARGRSACNHEPVPEQVKRARSRSAGRTRARHRLPMDKQKVSLIIEKQLGFEPSVLLDEVDALRKRAFAMETMILTSCSAYHDFIHDHTVMLRLKNERRKVLRVESRKGLLVRKGFDLEHRTHPSSTLLLGVFLPILTLTATYTISHLTYVDEEKTMTVLQAKGLFISATIDQAPASNIGTLGLTTSLMLLAMSIFIKHKIIKKLLRGRVWTLTRRTSLAFGMFSAFCGNGVAAFQHQDHAFMHNLFAALFFVTGMVHVVLETTMDWKNKISSMAMRRVRLVLCSMLVGSVCIFMGHMIYVLKGWCVAPQCSVKGKKRIAAIFEILAFVFFIVWFSSYYWMLKKSSFELQVHRKVELDLDMCLRPMNKVQPRRINGAGKSKTD